MVVATLECNNKFLNKSLSTHRDDSRTSSLKNISRVSKSHIQNQTNKFKNIALASVNFIGGTTEYLSDKLDSIINKIHRGISRTEGYVVPKKLHSLVYGEKELYGKLTASLIKGYGIFSNTW